MGDLLCPYPTSQSARMFRLPHDHLGSVLDGIYLGLNLGCWSAKRHTLHCLLKKLEPFPRGWRPKQKLSRKVRAGKGLVGGACSKRNSCCQGFCTKSRDSHLIRLGETRTRSLPRPRSARKSYHLHSPAIIRRENRARISVPRDCFFMPLLYLINYNCWINWYILAIITFKL